MIGIVAKLAKAAKLAQTAEAAIDVASSKIGAGDSPEKPSEGEKESTVAELPAGYQALLDTGVPDARRLLSSAEAARIIGKPIRKILLSGGDGVLACDYLCGDRAGTTLGVHVAVEERWDYFDTEVPKKELFDDVGDAAFRGGRQIYVKAGETVFWIHTAGEVMVNMALDAARRVVRSLAAAQPE